MTPRRTPSRDDDATTRCPVCQQPFTPAGRRAYCSPRCRKTAFRRRHQNPPEAIVIPAARPRRQHAIYECPGCGARQAGLFSRQADRPGCLAPVTHGWQVLPEAAEAGLT